jgi:mRNA-degrading endonuclease RelE of RelBE toxin-antitoxin system
MQPTQIKVNLSLLFASLIEMMQSLGLQEKIRLRDLLDREINASQTIETEEDSPIESFERGWEDAMNGRTKPISELWEGIDALNTASKTATTQKKSAGYRVIYYARTTTSVILITIYSKSEQADILASEIERIIEKNQNP